MYKLKADPMKPLLILLVEILAPENKYLKNCLGKKPYDARIQNNNRKLNYNATNHVATEQQ